MGIPANLDLPGAVGRSPRSRHPDAAARSAACTFAETRPASFPRLPGRVDDRWRDTTDDPDGVAPDLRRGADTSAGAADRGLLGISTDQLRALWRSSATAVANARYPTSLTQWSEQRRRYLDELQRRDPVGFTRWAAESPCTGDGPEVYRHQPNLQGRPEPAISFRSARPRKTS